MAGAAALRDRASRCKRGQHRRIAIPHPTGLWTGPPAGIATAPRGL